MIDESYNANPLSVKNAINKLNLIKKEKFKKYLILGDMLELGSKSKNIIKNFLKLLTILILIKYSLKEKKHYSLINIFIKIKEEIFCKITKI